MMCGRFLSIVTGVIVCVFRPCIRWHLFSFGLCSFASNLLFIKCIYLKRTIRFKYLQFNMRGHVVVPQTRTDYNVPLIEVH